MAGSVSAQMSNTLVSLFNIHKPEKANFLFRKYGKQGVTAFQFLQSVGAVTPVAQGSFSHYEEDWIHATLTPSVVGAAGVNGLTDVTLSAADMDSSGNSYPRVGDIVMFSNGVKGQIVTKSGANPAVLGIVPLLSANSIATSAVVGEQAIITSNAFAEGTNQPEGRVSAQQ